MNIYIMPNDSDLLLARVAQEMPDALRLKEIRAAAGQGK
jgi:hypothetical protein